MHRTLAETEGLHLPELNGHTTASSNGKANGEGKGEANGQANGHGSVEKTQPMAASPESGIVRIQQDRLKIKTLGEFDVIDITGEVERAITRCGITEGYALVYSPHTTCAVLLNEKESGLLCDMNATLTRLVPEGVGYLHDDFDVRTENMQENETRNAHAHLRQMLAGKTSEYIPISKGSLLLGQWQRVMFVEFDCSRDREALIQVCGI